MNNGRVVYFIIVHLSKLGTLYVPKSSNSFSSSGRRLSSLDRASAKALSGSSSWSSSSSSSSSGIVQELTIEADLSEVLLDVELPEETVDIVETGDMVDARPPLRELRPLSLLLWA